MHGGTALWVSVTLVVCVCPHLCDRDLEGIHGFVHQDKKQAGGGQNPCH